MNKNSEQLIDEIMESIDHAMRMSENYGITVGLNDIDTDYKDFAASYHNDVENKLKEFLQYTENLEEENKALKQELMFACQFDGYVGVEKDRYDFAIEFMDEAGRDKPSFEDEVNGLRKLIQLAMENENGTN